MSKLEEGVATVQGYNPSIKETCQGDLESKAYEPFWGCVATEADAQLVECSPGTCEAPGSIPSTIETW